MSNTLWVDVVFYSHIRTYSTKGNSRRQNKILVRKEGMSLAIYKTRADRTQMK